MNELNDLKKRVTELENMLKSGARFDETIRDIVFFDIDNTASRLTQVATDSANDTVTIGRIPTRYVKTYIRGEVHWVPLMKFT